MVLLIIVTNHDPRFFLRIIIDATVTVTLPNHKNDCVVKLKVFFSNFKGDSGGPLYIVENGKQFVVGIVSFGPEYCNYGIR